MRIAHFADTHIGFRQFHNTMSDGTNQREADVARAFVGMLDKIIEQKPDAILIAGDFFQTNRPPNRALMFAFAQFVRLRAALPKAEIVLVAGDHDLPRATETGCILRIFENAGVRVSDRAERLWLFDRTLQILAVPKALGPLPPLTPEPGGKYRVLLLHGQMAGVIPQPSHIDIPVEDLNADGWDYIALGHFHKYQQVGPNAFYSGSLEYTASNFWSELEDGRSTGKGFVMRDLETGAHEFIRLEPQRQVVDIPEFSAAGMGVAELDAAIAAAVESVEGGIDGKIVRARVNNVMRDVRGAIDQKQIREFKRRAFDFRLLMAKAEAVVSVTTGLPAMVRGRRESVPDTLRAFIDNREISPDIDKEKLKALGLKYLDEVARDAGTENKPPTAVTAEAE